MRTSRGTHHTLLSKDSVPSIADSVEQWLFHREELAALDGEIVESVASRTSSLPQISAAC